jgi:3-hydroxyisobutyrate dehydrogenase-like beta-hydroxyacid dehydrogenase
MTTSTHPTIGFVGLGHMGGALAARLLAAGYPVVGTSRSRASAEGLVGEGLHWRVTPRQVAEESDVFLTSLPNDATLSEVASGPDGALAGLRPGSTWLEMSTVSPGTSQVEAQRAEEQGVALLDAPVSGSPPQARAGTLAIMVGGDEEAYSRVEPVLREFGTPTHVGSNGQGLVLKLAINISLAVQMLAFAEGLLLAERSGVDRDVALRVMADSAIGSPMLRARSPLVFHLPDEALFTIALMRKDVELALAVARRLDVPLPTADRADAVLTRAHALGYDDRDLAALYQVLDLLRTEAPTAA